MTNQPEMKVYADGTKYWYLNGDLHREGGPAYENADGTKFWYLNGKYHREDGPALEYPDGTKHWFLNGEYHREGGPAVECANGTKAWYLNDIKFSFEDYIQELRLLGKEEAVINLLFQLDSV
jgi:hypothetical protein